MATDLKAKTWQDSQKIGFRSKSAVTRERTSVKRSRHGNLSVTCISWNMGVAETAELQSSQVSAEQEVIAHACNPSKREAEAGLLGV